jgi:hypothetical protein
VSEPVELQELQEISVLQVLKGLLDRLAKTDKQVVQEHKEILAQLALPDSKVLLAKVLLVLLESRAQLVLQVLWVIKVLQV